MRSMPAAADDSLFFFPIIESFFFVNGYGDIFTAVDINISLFKGVGYNSCCYHMPEISGPTEVI